MVTTFNQHKDLSASEKILLVRLESSKRLKGWSVYSGSVYSVAFTEPRVSSISQNGTDLVESATLAGITAGKWFFDRANSLIYLQTSDSADPDTKFIGCIFELFFADTPVRAAHDLGSGYAVEWKNLLKSSSNFGVELDNREANMGSAIEGAGQIGIANDFEFWSSRFDKYSFQNRRATVYQYSRSLPIAQAKKIYTGIVDSATYGLDQIQFSLRDLMNALRSPIATTRIGDLPGVRVNAGTAKLKARRIYGHVFGHVCKSVDQVNQSYPLTGTIVASVGSSSFTGSGTDCLNELRPGDEILIGDDTDPMIIDSVTGATGGSFTEAYAGQNSNGAAAVLIRSRRPKRYTNRVFKVAHHSLAKPETTIATSLSDRVFTVDDPTSFTEGDPIEVNGESRKILKLSGSRITLNQSLTTKPDVGDDVYRSSVDNVYINDRKLVWDRDYTYDASDAEITLDTEAEKNVAPIIPLETGTIAISNGSRTLAGTGTTFKSELNPGDWIRAAGGTNFFELLSIESDISATLVQTPGLGDVASGVAAKIKKPEYFDERSSILSCDALGKTDDGTPSGVLLSYPYQIVEDILTEVGLSDDLNAASFSSSPIEARHRVGVVSPMDADSADEEIARDLIKRVNRSVFGSIFQNNEFEIEYRVLRPEMVQDDVLELDRHDIVGIDIEADSRSMVKAVTVRYRNYEYEPVSKQASFSEKTSSSERAQYLGTTEKTSVQDSALVDESSARIIASRWRFMLEFPMNIVTVRTKLQAASVSINDLVRIRHPRLYERFGSQSATRLGLVSSIKKGAAGVVLSINDLGNAFARCARIAESDVPEWDSASDSQKEAAGFITEDDGMIENDPETDGINTIW